MLSAPILSNYLHLSFDPPISGSFVAGTSAAKRFSSRASAVETGVGDTGVVTNMVGLLVACFDPGFRLGYFRTFMFRVERVTRATATEAARSWETASRNDYEVIMRP